MERASSPSNPSQTICEQRPGKAPSRSCSSDHTGPGAHRTGHHAELCSPSSPQNCNFQTTQALLGPIGCTAFPALQRVTDTKRIFASKLGLDLQLPCASKGCAQHSVVSTWHSSTVPLFFCLCLVQVGLFMSEKHKWEKGPGKDRVKYHLRVKHHLKVTLRALPNLACWRDWSVFLGSLKIPKVSQGASPRLHLTENIKLKSQLPCSVHTPNHSTETSVRQDSQLLQLLFQGPARSGSS